VPANLLLVKYRQQFGLQPFIRYVLLGYALVTLLHLFLHGFWTSLLVRAVSGLAASGMTTLTVLYFLQGMAPAKRLNGAMVGICVPQLAIPLARALSPGCSSGEIGTCCTGSSSASALLSLGGVVADTAAE